jgi:hypothetical protein
MGFWFMVTGSWLRVSGYRIFGEYLYVYNVFVYGFCSMLFICYLSLRNLFGK